MVNSILEPDLLNAIVQHNKYPATFKIPSEEKILKIKAGMFVKVCHSSERFWVSITAMSTQFYKDTRFPLFYEGKIENDLVDEHPFKYGDIIKFQYLHILSIDIIPINPELEGDGS